MIQCKSCGSRKFDVRHFEWRWTGHSVDLDDETSVLNFEETEGRDADGWDGVFCAECEEDINERNEDEVVGTDISPYTWEEVDAIHEAVYNVMDKK